LEGVEICPNFVISVDALGQFERSFFTAHELAQMIPLYGIDVYEALLAANSWAQRFLPNAFPALLAAVPGRTLRCFRAAKRSAEWVFGGSLGDWWERRESQAKIRRLAAQAQDSGTCATSFTAECCKGHLQDHGSSIRRAYARRLQRVGLEADPVMFAHTDSASTSTAGAGASL
jgi:hypothetical protein